MDALQVGASQSQLVEVLPGDSPVVDATPLSAELLWEALSWEALLCTPGAPLVDAQTVLQRDCWNRADALPVSEAGLQCVLGKAAPLAAVDALVVVAQVAGRGTVALRVPRVPQSFPSQPWIAG